MDRIYYVKAALYLYPTMDKKIEKLNELVLKKALTSRTRIRPCEELANEIVKLTIEKEMLVDLKAMVKKALHALPKDDRKYIAYKYFKDKSIADEINTTCGYYLRHLNAVVNTFAFNLLVAGGTKDWFEKNNCNAVEQYVKKVIQHEKAYHNKLEV